ncbi:MAG TPA: class I SAM-dependent methyltransferase [Verrucomicrobiae bacterium]|nr:class I SAM-dependent methyltransferase [Verrucomicrobiae bacterium]
MINPTLRFSNRVENYVKYRPGYPIGLVETFTKECGLTAGSVVADIGSGTGILSELFLKNGNPVFGVEPNREMREAGSRLLGKYAVFRSINGMAEATTLADSSVDFVTAGQAFHWFDRERARKEFARILKPNGWVALIWNERLTDTCPFLRAYEDLLQKYGTDYATVDHRNVDADAITAFFAPQPFTLREFENRQVFDYDGVEGRLLSSSYTPESSHPNYQPMLEALRALFDKYQINGNVSFDYATRLYFGRLIRQLEA